MISLLRTKLIPVLVPRDFNVTPSMVRQKLKIPVEKMEYPPVERRLELTEPDQDHDITPLRPAEPGQCGVLCRDHRGLPPAPLHRPQQLRSLPGGLLCGLVLGYYLTTVQAFVSLTPTNVLLFLALWLIPTLLISGNVNRY